MSAYSISNTKKWILLFFCYCIAILSYGQDDFLFDNFTPSPSAKQVIREQKLLQNLDSLEDSNASDYELVLKYNSLTQFYLSSSNDYEQATLYNDKAFGLSDINKNPKIHAHTLMLKGRILNLRGLFGTAMETHLQALEIRKTMEDNSKVAQSYQFIGRTLRLQGRYEAALDYLIMAEQVRKEMQKPNAKLFQLIGTIYLTLKDYPNAEIYLKKALQLAEQQKRRKLYANTMIELATLDYYKGNYAPSLELLERTSRLPKQVLNTPNRVALWRIFAKNHIALGEIERAKFYIEKSYAIAQDAGIMNWKIHLLDDVAEVNKLLGFDKVTIDHLETQRSLKDSMYNLENIRLSTDYQTLYETRQKEKQLLEQEVVIAKQRANRNWLIGVFSLVSTFLVITFLFYRNQVQYRQALAAKNAEIQQQKIQELEQQQKILAMSAMIEGQEAERMRIAKDLHDGIGGLLTSVKAHFGAIETELQKVRELNIYEKTNDLIDEACVEVRRISHNMMPHALALSGLVGALEGIALQLEGRGIQCDIDTNSGIEQLEEQRAVMIYRIIQELVNNIQKHAEASQVLIQVLEMENSIQILVEDNGIGFEMDAVRSEKGLGLKSITSRVRYLNGELQYDSVLGTGTTVMINVPIAN